MNIIMDVLKKGKHRVSDIQEVWECIYTPQIKENGILKNGLKGKFYVICVTIFFFIFWGGYIIIERYQQVL